MMRGIKERLKERKVLWKGGLGLAAFLLTIGLLAGSNVESQGPSNPGDIIGTQETATIRPAGEQPASPGEIVPIADLAEKLSPTVVNIQVSKLEKTDMQGFSLPDSPFGDFFGRYFNLNPDEMIPRRSEGSGSGVIISRDGYLLTNHHVIDGATKVRVIFADDTEYEAKVVGSDPKTDLAVLKIKSDKSFNAAPLGNSDTVRVGEAVIAIGNPFGLSNTVTSGIVSAKGRVIGAGPYDDFIQTDASINPGNSGGPLFNRKGEVVGINTAINPMGQGIGFAVPINTAKPLIPQLIDNGKVVRGYIGLTIQPVTQDLAKAFNLEKAHGALVAEVVPGSPADKAGIQTGDVILTFNGSEIHESHELPAIVANTPIGEKTNVVVIRKGQEKSLTVHVAELEPKGGETPQAKVEDKLKWGLQLQDLTPELSRQLGLSTDKGALIAQVQPDSPADLAGLSQGDVIVEVNRDPVVSAREAAEALRNYSKESALLTVKREQGQRFVVLNRQSNG